MTLMIFLKKNITKKLQLIILCVVLTLGGCTVDSNDTIEDEPSVKTYTDERFGYRIDYPETFKGEITEVVKPSEENEGTPDSGIVIYLDESKENWIYAFGSIGKISIGQSIPSNFDSIEELQTSTGLKGKIYTSNSDARVYVYFLLDKHNIGVSANVSEEEYINAKERLMEIIKSIRLNNKPI